jgi:hypothetical protein
MHTHHTFVRIVCIGAEQIEKGSDSNLQPFFENQIKEK